MKILFDLMHPAHVHLFKNFIWYLKHQGHAVLVVSRNKEMTNLLLEHENIDYVSCTNPGKGIGGKALELLTRDLKILRLHARHHFEIAFGSAESLAHFTALTGVKSYHFDTNDDDFMPLTVHISYPFFTKIVIPNCLEYSQWKEKRIIHNSYHQLAFLHPHHFTPDKSILAKYHLEERKYVILRLCAHNAHHDLHVEGISEVLLQKLKMVLTGYQVITSRESGTAYEIDPWDIHHVLAFAKMIVSDSASMTAEGAVLGVPAFCIHNYCHRLGYLKELSQTYGLAEVIAPGREQYILQQITTRLHDKNTEDIWQQRREALLAEKEDLSRWMCHFFEKVSQTL